MSSLMPSSDFLLLRDLLPKNVYFLQKLFRVIHILKCMLCAQNVTLSTTIKIVQLHIKMEPQNRQDVHIIIQFADHPHLSRRVKCDTLLM